MTTYIALFRGVNVGGRGVLSMQELRSALEQEGCADVRTYVQSGNAVFRSPMSDGARLARRLRAAVADCLGVDVKVLVLTRAELERAAAANPFPQADQDPKRLHLFFLAAPPKTPDLESLEVLRAESERFELKRAVLYLYTPEGFGRSRLAARAERLLGVDATARNWRTVTALLQMARE